MLFALTLVCDAWGDVYIYNIYHLPKEDKEKFLALSDGKEMENMALDYMNAMIESLPKKKLKKLLTTTSKCAIMST